MKRKYRLRADSNVEVEAKRELQYSTCVDGIVVYGGTLPGSGFQPYYCEGITLPEEIDGVPVTELRGSFRANEIGYIEAPGLKRINITIEKAVGLFEESGTMRCGTPIICGGSQNTLESFDICFVGTKMQLNCFAEKKITDVTFRGEVVDDADWDYGSFKSEIFAGCSRLRNVNGYFNGWCLSGHTFDGCTSMISLPDIRVKYMSDCEFRNCSSISEIHLHNGLERMGSYVFENCCSLKDIYIPDTVKTLGYGVFKGCTNLSTVHLPDAITEIGNEMFMGCCLIKKVFLSNEISRIGNSAFEGCEKLQNPWIPRNLRIIGSRAFWGCSSIDRIVIPEHVEQIGEDAFGGCRNLIIKGYSNSIAEKYAIEHNIPFENI